MSTMPLKQEIHKLIRSVTIPLEFITVPVVLIPVNNICICIHAIKIN